MEGEQKEFQSTESTSVLLLIVIFIDIGDRKREIDVGVKRAQEHKRMIT